MNIHRTSKRSWQSSPKRRKVLSSSLGEQASFTIPSEWNSVRPLLRMRLSTASARGRRTGQFARGGSGTLQIHVFDSTKNCWRIAQSIEYSVNTLPIVISGIDSLALLQNVFRVGCMVLLQPSQKLED